MERHTYEPCDHPGRHGYTLPGDPGEYEFCERCRRGPEAHRQRVTEPTNEELFALHGPNTQEVPPMTTRTSTVNLTLTIETPGGVSADLTALRIAQIAEEALQPYLPHSGTVTGTVSSAFIVRTEPLQDGLTALEIDATDPAYRGLRDEEVQS